MVRDFEPAPKLPFGRNTWPRLFSLFVLLLLLFFFLSVDCDFDSGFWWNCSTSLPLILPGLCVEGATLSSCSGKLTGLALSFAD
jgi:hypothetical protein